MADQDPTKLLSTARADSVHGKSYVVAHNEFEKAISNIFGIEVGKNITQAIFGPVITDGSFFTMRFTSEARSSSAAGQAGIIFDDGNAQKKLTYVDSKISLWTKVGNTWVDQDYDFEGANEPALTDFLDCQSIQELTGSLANKANFGKIVGTVKDSDGNVVFDLVKNAVAEGGAQGFLDLNEVKEKLIEWQGHAATSVPGQFGSSVIGKLIGVSGANTLSPVATSVAALPISESYKVTAYLESEQFVTPTGWQLQVPQDTAAGTQGTAVPTGPIGQADGSSSWTVPAGVYAVKLSVNVLGGDMDGTIRWAVGGNPKIKRLNASGSYLTHSVPYEYYEPIVTTLLLPRKISYSGYHSPKDDMGTFIIVLTEFGSFNTAIWQNTEEAMNLSLTLSITRIS